MLGIDRILQHGIGHEVDNLIIGPGDSVVLPNRFDEGCFVADAKTSLQPSLNSFDRGTPTKPLILLGL
jgi:hypothetical protein